MSEASSYTKSDLIYIVLIGVPWLLSHFSPAIYSIFVSLRNIPSLPRKKLFVFTATSFTYAFICFLVLAFVIHTRFYLTYITPLLKHSGYYYGQPLVSIADFIISYWWLLVGPALFFSSIFITRYLRRSWVAIVAAIRV
jgi:hypothetical protein